MPIIYRDRRERHLRVALQARYSKYLPAKVFQMGVKWRWPGKVRTERALNIAPAFLLTTIDSTSLADMQQTTCNSLLTTTVCRYPLLLQATSP